MIKKEKKYRNLLVEEESILAKLEDNSSLSIIKKNSLKESNLSEEPEIALFEDSLFNSNKKKTKMKKTRYSLSALYLKRIGKLSLLTKEEEKELSIKNHLGCKEARDILFTRNLRLAIKNSYRSKYKSDLDFIDLIHEANQGLFKAIQNFDHTRGVKLATYSTWWLIQRINRAAVDKGSPIRLPIHIIEIMNKINIFITTYKFQFNKEPSLQEIAENFKETIKKISYILKICRKSVSLDLEVGTETNQTLVNFLCDDSLNPEEQFINDKFKKKIYNIINCLKYDEQEAIKLKYGILDKNIPFCNGIEKTLDEIGILKNLTRERIRQKVCKALTTIKRKIKYSKKYF